MTEEDKKLLNYFHFTRGTDYRKYYRLREIIPQVHPELEEKRKELERVKNEMDEIVRNIVGE
jgi:hypothetical protein